MFCPAPRTNRSDWLDVAADPSASQMVNTSDFLSSALPMDTRQGPPPSAGPITTTWPPKSTRAEWMPRCSRLSREARRA